MLYVIEADMERVIVHRIDYKEGKYLMPKYLDMTHTTTFFKLLSMIMEDKVDKVVFDEMGVSKGLADLVREMSTNPSISFVIDEFGNVIHRET